MGGGILFGALFFALLLLAAAVICNPVVQIPAAKAIFELFNLP